MEADVAVIGTGVMGSNLARNFARQPGRRVAIYDRDVTRARKLAEDFPDAGFIVASDPADLAGRLAGPRVAILMVNAGPATDSAIADLAEVFAPGDIIVDGGNSHFQDTIARGGRLAATGIEFCGDRHLRGRGRCPARRLAHGRGNVCRLAASAPAARTGRGPSRGPGDRGRRRDCRARPDRCARPDCRARPDRCARPDCRARGRAGRCRAGLLSLRRPHRGGRGRALRQDGPQRHRVRRYAAHRRSLHTPARRTRDATAPDRRGIRRMERRGARVLPRRDHRRSTRPRR
jgi:hypothetical protein